jgi:hypothetical protein
MFGTRQEEKLKIAAQSFNSLDKIAAYREKHGQCSNPPSEVGINGRSLLEQHFAGRFRMGHARKLGTHIRELRVQNGKGAARIRSAHAAARLPRAPQRLGRQPAIQSPLVCGEHSVAAPHERRQHAFAGHRASCKERVEALADFAQRRVPRDRVVVACPVE